MTSLLNYFYTNQKIDIIKTVTIKNNEKTFIQLPENVNCTVYVKSIDNKGGNIYFNYNDSTYSLCIIGKNDKDIRPIIKHETNGFYLSYEKEIKPEMINYISDCSLPYKPELGNVINGNGEKVKCSLTIKDKEQVTIQHPTSGTCIIVENAIKEEIIDQVTYIIRIIGI